MKICFKLIINQITAFLWWIQPKWVKGSLWMVIKKSKSGCAFKHSLREKQIHDVIYHSLIFLLLSAGTPSHGMDGFYCWCSWELEEVVNHPDCFHRSVTVCSQSLSGSIWFDFLSPDISSYVKTNKEKILRLVMQAVSNSCQITSVPAPLAHSAKHTPLSRGSCPSSLHSLPVFSWRVSLKAKMSIKWNKRSNIFIASPPLFAPSSWLHLIWPLCLQPCSLASCWLT